MIGWWVCRWESNTDDELGWRPIEFSQIIGDAPLPGRYIVRPMGAKDDDERYWHRATILRKWPHREDARAMRFAIRAAEEAVKRCIVGPGAREKVRDTLVVDLLTGAIA